MTDAAVCSRCGAAVPLWFCVKLCDTCIDDKVAAFKASGREPEEICGSPGPPETGMDCWCTLAPHSETSAHRCAPCNVSWED